MEVRLQGPDVGGGPDPFRSAARARFPQLGPARGWPDQRLRELAVAAEPLPVLQRVIPEEATACVGKRIAPFKRVTAWETRPKEPLQVVVRVRLVRPLVAIRAHDAA